MYRLQIQTSISAAHFLKEYDGNCSVLHGHNWKIEVAVKSEQVDKVGMVIDFKDLKEITWRVAGKYDHRVFNEVAPFDKQNPTAENISKHFYQEIGALLPADVKMDRIRLWETENYSIEYFE